MERYQGAQRSARPARLTRGAPWAEIRLIGRGNYGTAHLVKDVETNKKLVVRHPRTEALSRARARAAD